MVIMLRGTKKNIPIKIMSFLFKRKFPGIKCVNKVLTRASITLFVIVCILSVISDRSELIDIWWYIIDAVIIIFAGLFLLFTMTPRRVYNAIFCLVFTGINLYLLFWIYIICAVWYIESTGEVGEPVWM